jgi:hypothetical protein
MNATDDAKPPLPSELKGTSFFGNTPADAKEVALRYLGLSEPMR